MTRRLGALVAIALSASTTRVDAADGAAPALALAPSYDELVAREAQEDQEVAAARQAILELVRSDAGLRRFFERSAGYAVFATVQSGGAGLGGAQGAGVLFEEGEATGVCQLTRAALGPEGAARAYTEVLFFERGPALAELRAHGLTLDGRVVSADAAGRGSATARSVGGLSVFTLSWVGPRAGGDLGGQRLACHPLLPRLAAAR